MVDRTVLDLYRHDVEAPRSRHYTHWTPEGRRTLSTSGFFSKVTSLAESFLEIGVEAGDRVILLSEDRPEWHIVDLAVLDLGAVDVPIYSTLAPDQIAYQVNDSGAKVAVVEDADQMAKFLEILDRCPSLDHLIQIDGPREHGVLALNDMMSVVRGGAGARFWDRASAVDENDLMTIIYTSGTTGEPKGVMLSHRNLVANVLETANRAPMRRDDVALEFLPLCHVLERMAGYSYMLAATNKAYCSVYDVGELLPAIRPTVFAGVPRFYEKLRQAIYDRVTEEPALGRTLFRWAIDVGREAAIKRLAGKPVDGLLASRLDLAERLMLSKVREGLGGRIRFCMTGGAETPLHVVEFFHSIGIWLAEGYGLTETSPVVSLNGLEPGTLRIGAAGRPLDNLEIALGSDDELLVRGPSVMMGYWNKPVETSEVLDEDGFFHTGDIAEVDDDGYLLIIDRKKDLIVTAGGKNVAPRPIERLISLSPFVDNVVLIGDEQPYVTALVSPDFDQLEQWAAENKIVYADFEELVAHRLTRDLFGELLYGTNAGLARFEQIKKFRVVPMTLTLEDGHLTPTFKVKRRVIQDVFAAAINDMYRGGANRQ